MKNLRTHGKPPFSVAVVHGGPGAAGEMAPVARTLAAEWGVLEPLQTATSLTGQIEELRTVLAKPGAPPVRLIGFSWGAWLSYLVAAPYPSLVQKLILVSSGAFEEKYVASLHETRSSRLDPDEQIEFAAIIKNLADPTTADRTQLLTRLGALTAKTDSLDPILTEASKAETIALDGDIFHRVWYDAAELRRSGKLIELGRHIKCPVVAIHGDYDPSPAEGVQRPLAAILGDFRFIVLENCGHTPWIDRQAHEGFFEILRAELR